MPRRRILASIRVPPLISPPKPPSIPTQSPLPSSQSPSLSSLQEALPSKLLTSLQNPPSASVISAANNLFTIPKPTHIYSSPSFRLLPQNPPASFSNTSIQTPCPEIVLLGASNAGKSSLINALFGRSQPSKPGRIIVSQSLDENGKPPQKKQEEFARVSRRPGFTKSLELYSLSGSRVLNSRGGKDRNNTHFEIHPPARPTNALSAVLVDTPGYGAASRSEWGEVITKYIFKRKALRRVFLLLSCEAAAPWIISPRESSRNRKHKVKAGVFTDEDRSVVEMLKEAGVPWQVVLTKADGVLWPGVNLSSCPALQVPQVPDEGMLGLSNLVREIQTAIMNDGANTTQSVPGFVEEVIVTSCLVPSGAKTVKFGIDALRAAIWKTVGGHV